MLLFSLKLPDVSNFYPLQRKQAFCDFGTRRLIATTALKIQEKKTLVLAWLRLWIF